MSRKSLSFTNMFRGILNLLPFTKTSKANKILKGERATDRTVHVGNGFKHGSSKGQGYFGKALAKRRMRNKMRRKTRQKQIHAMG